uniref:Variable lymphocyte receptor A cassette n=1 Tax=Taenia asiatica TaxID=60517 RepID=A0A0R3WHC2_TAEAS
LANLKNLTGLSLSRHRFTVFPSGGPQQFVSTQVRSLSLSEFMHSN